VALDIVWQHATATKYESDAVRLKRGLTDAERLCGCGDLSIRVDYRLPSQAAHNLHTISFVSQ
jgi:hypothetical protein